MPSGGHARSGPAPDPRSGASDRKGLKFKSLPAAGYDGDVPDFPGAPPSARAQAWWDWAWKTPQAALWATNQWSWVVPMVADWCTLKAKFDEPDAPVSLVQAIRQREGDILLSNDALLRAGYTVVVDEIAELRDAKATEPSPPSSARERAKRLRSVGNE